MGTIIAKFGMETHLLGLAVAPQENVAASESLKGGMSQLRGTFASVDPMEWVRPCGFLNIVL